MQPKLLVQEFSSEFWINMFWILSLKLRSGRVISMQASIIKFLNRTCYDQIGLFSKCMEINCVFQIVLKVYHCTATDILMILSWSVHSFGTALFSLCVVQHSTVQHGRCTVRDSSEIFSQDSGQFSWSCEVQHCSLSAANSNQRHYYDFTVRNLYLVIWTIRDNTAFWFKINHEI